MDTRDTIAIRNTRVSIDITDIKTMFVLVLFSGSSSIPNVNLSNASFLDVEKTRYSMSDYELFSDKKNNSDSQKWILFLRLPIAGHSGHQNISTVLLQSTISTRGTT